MTESRHRAAAREWLDGFVSRLKAPDAATSTFANDLDLAALLARFESEAVAKAREELYAHFTEVAIDAVKRADALRREA